jgi:DNA-binding transcriptional ArsR family regulator
MDNDSVIGESTRQKILHLLTEQERSVGEIVAAFPHLSQPAVSRHLRILRTAGLVRVHREGQKRIYRVRPERMPRRTPGRSKDSAPPAPGGNPPQGGMMNAFLTATHLVRWADERRSQDMLPFLVRRIVLASMKPIRCDFPGGDSVNRPGYDGLVQTVEGTFFVPSGQSVWEMGADKNVSRKANEDYAARTRDPETVDPAQTTFVFVTPRRWSGKIEWAQAKQAENVWADVRAYDADDLEQALAHAPPAAAWAFRQIAGAPEGVHDLGEIWEIWSERTRPPLSAEIFLAGRTTEAEHVTRWLSGPPSILRIAASTADEAIAFFAAVVQAFPEAEREKVHSRSLLVSTASSWRAIAGQATPVVLLATSPLGAESQAVARDHHVLLAYGHESAGLTTDIRLGHLLRRPMVEALRKMGLSDDNADRLAAESKGSLSVLVDLLGGATALPHWGAPAVARSLTPLLLAGSWSQSEADTAVLLRLSGLQRNELSSLLARWVNEMDPPLRQVAGVWEWVSRRRAWPHLSRYITPSDVATFRELALDVLGERDPRLELPPDDRWMAAAHQKVPKYSEHLRKGFAETLALLGTQHPVPIPGYGDSSVLAKVLVRELFAANADPRWWYSVAPYLPVLAEAAPDIFLSAIERDVLAQPAVRDALFQEEGLFGGSQHTHLLWALETLAWCPEYLTKAALILAALTKHDPGGRLANRPPESLRMIFLPWHPYTMATVPERLSAIDALYSQHPDTTFGLCVPFLRGGPDTATPTPAPHWRDWKVDREKRVPIQEVWATIHGLFDRALAWAGHDQARWAALLDHVPQVSPDRLAKLFDRLDAIPFDRFADEPSQALRSAIRRMLHRKRSYEGIDPELTPDLVDRLERVYARLEPTDLLARHTWLFEQHPELPTVTETNWRAEEAAIEEARIAAIREILAVHGTSRLHELADAAEAPWAVGFYIGKSDVSDTDLVPFLSRCVGEQTDPRHGFFRGLVSGRLRRDGWPWVLQTALDPLRDWAPEAKAAFAAALQFESRTWDWVEQLGSDVASVYWRTVNAHWVDDPGRDARRAIESYLAHARPFSALRILSHWLHGEKDTTGRTPDLLLTVLRAITSAATGDLATMEKPRGDTAGYEIGELISAVEASGAAGQTELAKIEWVWFPVLNRSRHGFKTLETLLANDPKFLAELVRLVFRPRQENQEEEPTPPDEATQQRAKQAYQLLHEWKGFPGRDTAGGVRESDLSAWVTGARGALRESGHAAVGDHVIGEVLSRAPVGADDVWPHEAIRNLLEDLKSDDLDEGLYLGVLNGRGVTSRSLDAGGALEREAAAKYSRWAAALAFASPRTARVLRDIAEHYERDARREDEERDLREFR